jgi:signal transduction histidine kinase/DNA-binding response OmpR family regulator
LLKTKKSSPGTIQERLESLGYTIAAQATSGAAAILAANQVKPNLVLMDIQLQGEMDGIEAAQIIYQNHNIPVIYLTAHSDDRTLAAAASTNPFGYILKPFQARELHSTIQIALHRHDQESLGHRRVIVLQDKLGRYSQVLMELLDENRAIPPKRQRSRNLLEYLGTVLDLDYAWIARHDRAQRTSTVIDEYHSHPHQPTVDPASRPSLLHQSIQLTDATDFYQRLLLGRNWIDPPAVFLPPAYAAVVQPQDQVIICPIVAKQGLGQPPVIVGEVGIIATGTAAWQTPLQTQMITQIVSCAASLSRQDELEAIGEAQDIDLSMLNYLKADFIGSISHAFKTPLENMKQTISRIETAIHQIEPLAIGTADFRTQQNQIKQKLIHHLEVLETEWRLENDLVNNLLNFQTALIPIAASAMSLIPIDELITEIVELFNLAASRFKQEWCYEILPETLQVFSHRASLQRIVQELLHNAVKYTPPNHQIRIRAQLIDHTFELQIMSTGITIAADELVQIFQPFYRIPRPNPWDYCGMGMGLALVQKLSLQIGGSITAASSRSGTTFTFTLPQS